MTHRLTFDPLPIATPRVVHDATRLVRARDRAVATGIDRIDLALARDLAARFGPDCRFVHACWGGYAELPRRVAAALLAALDARWHEGAPAAAPDMTAALAWGRVESALRSDGLGGPEVTYVTASHTGLPRRAGLLARLAPGRRAAYIHDLIPLEHPAYQTEAARLNLARFLAELAAGPTDWFTNSKDTAARLTAYAEAQGWPIAPPCARRPRLSGAAGTGPLRPEVAALATGTDPFFLCVGTIEPRKNHRLLLDIWRDLGAAPPRLVIAGRRGWMIDDIAARLDAGPPGVTAFTDLTDAEISALMRRARALLLPSFAEGFGLPLLEAQAAGLPVIVSDLPALREVAAPGAMFLDPGEPAAWRAEIIRRSAAT